MSTSEGLPLAVIEALSCGLPVILSAISSHKDLFLLDNNIGVLITVDLRTSLEAVRKFNKDEMGQNAYNLYLKYFTSKKMAEAYSKLYYKVFS
jgi:glycosyltransferase involved in cell wall biosynthesis